MFSNGILSNFCKVYKKYREKFLSVFYFLVPAVGHNIAHVTYGNFLLAALRGRYSELKNYRKKLKITVSSKCEFLRITRLIKIMFVSLKKRCVELAFNIFPTSVV